MPINFDKITDSFIDDLDKLSEKFIRRIEQGLKGGLSAVNLAQLDAEINFFAELNNLGFASKVEEFFNNYDDIVKELHRQAVSKGVAGIAGTTANELEILADNEALFILDKGRLYTQEFKTSIFRSIIGGETIGDILPSLRNIALTDAQLTTGVTTGITRFQAAAVGKIYEGSPNQKFFLSGPLDAKTRDTCRAVLNNQPEAGFTRAEIDAGAWTNLAGDTYTFIDRGGFNCRHSIEPL